MRTTSRNMKAIKGLAMLVGALAYAAAVIFGDVMFIVIMQDVFPVGILGLLAIVGAVTTAMSALALPVAMHFWFAPGYQSVGGWIFWLADIFVLALNSILAFNIATGQDFGLYWWQGIAPASPMLAVLGWGMMFNLDPSNKLVHAEIETEADAIDDYVAEQKTAREDVEVQKIIREGAQATTRNIAAKVSGARQSPNGYKATTTYAAEVPAGPNPTPPR